MCNLQKMENGIDHKGKEVKLERVEPDELCMFCEHCFSKIIIW